MIDADFPGIDKKIGLVGIPLGFGAGKIGSELGVTAMRLSQIRGKRLVEHIADLGYDVNDFGDVAIVNPGHTEESGENPKHLDQFLMSAMNIADSIHRIFDDGRFPIILGGDHSVAIGSFSGISAWFRERNEDIGLIWFDAHADMNTPETSPSGNLHGMPLATLFGEGNRRLTGLHGFSPKLNPKYCAHVGARDLDIGEKQLIRKLGLEKNFFTMSDIDKRGMLACVSDALEIASQASGGYAVTFDVDCIDPRFAPGSGTLVRGGLTYREAHLALEVIAEKGGMRSFEVVEVNPLLDSSNITVELAGELILSALGKKIL